MVERTTFTPPEGKYGAFARAAYPVAMFDSGQGRAQANVVSNPTANNNDTNNQWGHDDSRADMERVYANGLGLLPKSNRNP
jgi:glycerate kinase